MIKISFLGDISLNDDYIKMHINDINPFEHITHELQQSDAVIGNLECMVTGNEGENFFKKPRLKTTPDTLQLLPQLNIKLLTLAHNHVYDNLLSGFNNTVATLKKLNIAYVGASNDSNKARLPHKMFIKGKMFVFFNYANYDTNPNIPNNAGVSINSFEQNKAIKDLSEFNGDYKIVLLHWGGRFEGGKYPGLDQIKIARMLINAGASIVIGHHTHTAQPFHTINGKYVFYSLGNFCFANVHSDGKIYPIHKQGNQSFILNVEFKEEQLIPSITPIVNRNLIIHHYKSSRSIYTVRNNIFMLMRIIKPLWYIYYFNFKFVKPVVYQFVRKDANKSLWQRFRELNLRKVLAILKNK